MLDRRHFLAALAVMPLAARAAAEPPVFRDWKLNPPGTDSRYCAVRDIRPGQLVYVGRNVKIQFWNERLQKWC